MAGRSTTGSRLSSHGYCKSPPPPSGLSPLLHPLYSIRPKSENVNSKGGKISGLGKSANSRFYSIKSAEEAVRYLAHPILGPRLRTAVRIIFDLTTGKHLTTLLGNEILVAKVNSCVTLFATMSLGDDSVFFMRVLDKLWNGKACGRTLQILDSWVRLKTTGERGIGGCGLDGASSRDGLGSPPK